VFENWRVARMTSENTEYFMRFAGSFDDVPILFVVADACASRRDS